MEARMFRICGVSRQDKRSSHPITLTASSSTRLAFIVVVILLAQQIALSFANPGYGFPYWLDAGLN
jgi:hypothetical protein